MILSLSIATLRTILAAGTPGPWFDGYCSIHSKPLFDEYNRLEREIPSDALDDDPRWEALPETAVAHVPVVGGDTATNQGRKDMALICAAVNALGPLLEIAEAVQAWRDSECTPRCERGEHVHDCPTVVALRALGELSASFSPPRSKRAAEERAP